MSRFITTTFDLTGELALKRGTSLEIVFGFLDGTTPVVLTGSTVRGVVIVDGSKFTLSAFSAETFASSGLTGSTPATNELLAFFSKPLINQIPVGTHRYELYVDFSPVQTWCPIEGEVQFRP